jgi:hypothetical protein
VSSRELNIAAFFTAMLFSSLAAQAQDAAAAIDLGISRTRYADTLDASAVVLSPNLRFVSSSGTVSATGSYSRFEEGRWSTQGNVAASLFTPKAKRFAAEGVAALGGSAHQDKTRTGRVIGMARGHVLGSSRGIWLGAGLGRMWDGILWRPTRLGEAGIWLRRGSAIASLKATPTVVADTTEYTDMDFLLAWTGARAELAGTFGARAGTGLPELGGTAKTWGNGIATLWLTRALALVGSVGTYPSDLTQGFPSGQFATLGLRLATRGYRGPAPTEAAISARYAGADSLAPTGPIKEFRHTRAGANQTLWLHAPGAAMVEVMGDFSNWAPVRLARTSGEWWTVTLPLRPGTYEMNVRADGGQWEVPPGLVELADEFGGSVGMLVVREGM